jgi:hypothetical protein
VRLLLTITLFLFSARALAQADAGAPEPPEGELQFREPGAEFRWSAPPEVGSCVGGNCGVVPRTQVFGQPVPPPSGDAPRPDPRMRFAYTGAVLGVVSAGLLLGGSIAIAELNAYHSERITRGVWVGYLGLSTGLVALSAHLARNSMGSSEASKATRRVGWTAFAFALTDGAILWAGSFRGFTHVDALTIGAGAIAVLALLPHALDALVAGRALRVRRFGSLEPMANGLRLRF